MFMSLFLVLSSSLLVTFAGHPTTLLLVHVCKSKTLQGNSIKLFHNASEAPLSSSCSCSINTASDVSMETEPGKRCSKCVHDKHVQKTCTVHCESLRNQGHTETMLLHNGANISINVTNIDGTIMSLTATNGNLKVHCNKTDPVTITTNKNEATERNRQSATAGGNGENPQMVASVEIDVCSSNRTRGRSVKFVRGRDEPQTRTCRCSIRSDDCLTMKHPSNNASCRICVSGNDDDGSNCVTRCKKTHNDCTQNVNITVNAVIGNQDYRTSSTQDILIMYGHKGSDTEPGSAVLEVSCNPASPTSIDEGEPSSVPTTTVAAAVTSVAILIVLAVLFIVVTYRRRRRPELNPVYMTLEAGSGRLPQSASPSRTEGAPGERQNGETARGSNPNRDHISHRKTSATVHHPTEGSVEGQSHQGEDRSETTYSIPIQDTADEGMYDSARIPCQGPGGGGGGVYGKLAQDPGEEGVYDQAHATPAKVQQVTSIYGRLGQQVDDDVYDHARRSEVTASVTGGSTYTCFRDVAENDMYNH